MPYSNTRELPPAVTSLPSHAKHIFMAAFNSAYKDNNEESAFKIAWAAVKKSYHKDAEGNWVTNAD